MKRKHLILSFLLNNKNYIRPHSVYVSSIYFISNYPPNNSNKILKELIEFHKNRNIFIYDFENCILKNHSFRYTENSTEKKHRYIIRYVLFRYNNLIINNNIIKVNNKKSVFLDKKNLKTFDLITGKIYYIDEFRDDVKEINI